MKKGVKIALIIGGALAVGAGAFMIIRKKKKAAAAASSVDTSTAASVTPPSVDKPVVTEDEKKLVAHIDGMINWITKGTDQGWHDSIKAGAAANNIPIEQALVDNILYAARMVETPKPEDKAVIDFAKATPSFDYARYLVVKTAA